MNTPKDPIALAREALQAVVDWKLPATGKFWEDGSPMSFGAAWGSNGERDHFRQVARTALAALEAALAAAPPASAPVPDGWVGMKPMEEDGRTGWYLRHPDFLADLVQDAAGKWSIFFRDKRSTHEAYFDEAAPVAPPAQPAAEGEAQHAPDESGWLIEYNYLGAPTSWLAVTDDPTSVIGKQHLGHVHDASKALRLARKEDAEAVMALHVGQRPPDWYAKLYSVTEHLWPAPSAAEAPAVAQAVAEFSDEWLRARGDESAATLAQCPPAIRDNMTLAAASLPALPAAPSPVPAVQGVEAPFQGGLTNDELIAPRRNRAPGPRHQGWGGYEVSGRGYAAIGLFQPKSAVNVGSALRAAGCYGAAMVVTTGRRFGRGPTDTMKVYRHLPLIQCDDLHDVVPFDCVPVAVDLINGAQPLDEYKHPERAFYIFGPEDGTLGERITSWCRDVVYVPTNGCMNLAATVNVVLYDRAMKARAAITRATGPASTGDQP